MRNLVPVKSWRIIRDSKFRISISIQLSLTNPCDALHRGINVLQTKVDAQRDKLATELS